MSAFELLLAYHLIAALPEIDRKSLDPLPPVIETLETKRSEFSEFREKKGLISASLSFQDDSSSSPTPLESLPVESLPVESLPLESLPLEPVSLASQGISDTENLLLSRADLANNEPSLIPQLWQTVKDRINDSTQAVSDYLTKVWTYVSSIYQPAVADQSPSSAPGTTQQLAESDFSGEDAGKGDRTFVISPDVDQLHLAAIDVLDDKPQLDPDNFEPLAGPRFNEDGSVTFRVLVGNSRDRLRLIGDFNYWGNGVNLDRYELQPIPDNPLIHEITLPPGNYHKAQYRLIDQNGNQRLDMTAPLFSTPAFNDRFYNYRSGDELNSVLWQPTPIPEEELAEAIDLRGKPLSILETDIVSLSLRWQCDNPNSSFFNQTGAENIAQLYRFVGECGLPEKLAQLGYNAIQFMPLDTHVDFWEPGAAYFPDWRYGYQTINFYGKHADFGSPDELKRMVNAFHQAEVAVILDVVYSHYSDRGNNPPRQFGPLGFSTYKREDGWELYGGPWTEWGTRRFTYSPEIRRNIVDAALINILDYGFDGLRIDNVNGIDYEPYGRDLLREIAEAVKLYRPQAVVIGEGYFGDPYLNRALDYGGAGLTTTYCDRFYLWFTEDLIKHREEIDTWRLDYMLNKDWHRALLYYPGNHDEFANPGNPFQARGRYLVDAINGGDFHNRKIQSWSAMDMFASSYYLDMFQLWTMQAGNLNSNAAIDWSRLQTPSVAEVVNLQADMKRFFLNEPAFAPYNMHRHMVHWIDHENKVIVFERIDFATGKRVYAVVNLGDQQFEHYKIPVYPEDALFQMALDSDRPIYGGKANNPALIQAENHEVEIFLGSYGVAGLVQQDKITPIELPPEESVTPLLPSSSGYRRMFFPFN